MTDSTPRRGSRSLLAALAVLVAVVVLARMTDDVVVTDVVAIPDPGTVAVQVLDNGTPVFVVHGPPSPDGGPAVIDVIQAFTPEVEGPVTGLVGWCAGSQQFTQPHLGPLYDVRGRRLPSSTTGRLPQADLFGTHTALDDMVHREVTQVEGRDQPDDPLVVGDPQQLQDFQVADRPALSPAVPPGSCRLPEVEDATRVVTQGEGSREEFTAAELQLLDHGFLAGALDPAASGWQITTGWLVVRADGIARWCDEEPALRRASDGSWRTACDDAPDVAIGFGFRPEDVGGVPAVIGGPLAARADDGVLQRVAVLPGSTWRGSSLRGTEVVRGTLTGFEGPWQALLLTAIEEGGACRDRYQPTGEDAGGRRLPVEPGIPIAVQYGAVAVTVDAVTCRALRVDPQG